MNCGVGRWDRMRLIDADALERNGWHMNRTVRVDKDTMEIQTRKPTDFPTIEPQRKRGKWIKLFAWRYICSECGDWWTTGDFNYCPNCGADMRGTE